MQDQKWRELQNNHKKGELQWIRIKKLTWNMMLLAFSKMQKVDWQQQLHLQMTFKQGGTTRPLWKNVCKTSFIHLHITLFSFLHISLFSSCPPFATFHFSFFCYVEPIPLPWLFSWTLEIYIYIPYINVCRVHLFVYIILHGFTKCVKLHKCMYSFNPELKFHVGYMWQLDIGEMYHHQFS